MKPRSEPLLRHCRLAALTALLACCAAAGADAPADQRAAAAVAEAQRLLALGDGGRAIAALAGSLEAVEHADAPELRVAAWSVLGHAYLQTGQLDQALAPLQRAADLAQSTPLPALLPGALNDLGLAQAAQHDDDAALADYAQGLAAAAAQPETAAAIQVNAADLLLRRAENAAAEQRLQQVLELLQGLAPTPRKVLLATAASSRLLDLNAAGADARRTALLGPVMERTLREAALVSDQRGRSEALGAMGRLRQDLDQPDAALEYTRQAMFQAQAAQAPELLYRWEWQAARLMLRRHQPEQAQAFYRRALLSLEPIRHDLLLQSRASGASYRGTVGPLFLEFTDLLLQQSGGAADAAQRRRTLLEAREVMEQLKTVQLEDYFHDDCVAQFQSRQHDIDQLEPKTAVLYPIVLPDRLEILLSIGEGIERHTVAVSGKTLSDTALRFRKLLVKRTTHQYLPDAQQLYAWLIQPVRAQLEAAGIDTLVVVPDGALLGIPFSALHDGQDFLVRHYAVATVPGLHLIEPRRGGNNVVTALLGGLSEPVQGFPALPSVEDELRDVGSLYSSQLLDNQRFTLPGVEQTVRKNPFKLIHIASHGKFDSEASKSFLLTYDGRMGMDSLERIVQTARFRDDPVDLLTLSACETAAGDERAALGLAGVAIKAGARSVVATLWFINDEASSALIGAFYRELGKNGGTSKAKALQAAQLKLMADLRYRHPGYWAPFLVVGNWT